MRFSCNHDYSTLLGVRGCTSALCQRAKVPTLMHGRLSNVMWAAPPVVFIFFLGAHCSERSIWPMIGLYRAVHAWRWTSTAAVAVEWMCSVYIYTGPINSTYSMSPCICIRQHQPDCFVWFQLLSGRIYWSLLDLDDETRYWLESWWDKYDDLHYIGPCMFVRRGRCVFVVR
jgi:hypothetical protein